MATSNIKDIGGEAKTRYYKKLKDVEMDRCPYQIPSDAWKNDRTKWSDFEFQEICVYLTETPGIFTRESIKIEKALKHTANLSVAG